LFLSDLGPVADGIIPCSLKWRIIASSHIESWEKRSDIPDTGFKDVRCGLIEIPNRYLPLFGSCSPALDLKSLSVSS
jgi:hypothetical protein